ncbi:hypothetical protein D3C84_830060 [compost metagenome]
MLAGIGCQPRRLRRSARPTLGQRSAQARRHRHRCGELPAIGKPGLQRSPGRHGRHSGRQPRPGADETGRGDLPRRGQRFTPCPGTPGSPAGGQARLHRSRTARSRRPVEKSLGRRRRQHPDPVGDAVPAIPAQLPQRRRPAADQPMARRRQAGSGPGASAAVSHSGHLRPAPG